MLRHEKKCASNTTAVDFHRRTNDKTALNGLAKIHQIFPELQEMFDILVFMINENFQKIFRSFDEFQRKGSSWTLKKLYVLKYTLLNIRP